MKLLVLGGTRFVGRAAVAAALARGHEVTLFNRGRTNAEVFPAVEKLRGDRDGDLSALRRRSWDAVIDPSGYLPRVVRMSAELLASAAGYYVFVSSGSVYRDPVRPGYDESAPVVELGDPSNEEITGETYGGLKVLCERVVAEVFGDAHAHVRSGLVVGPHDPTGRFTYWVLRVAHGGDVLAPAPRERPVQFVDARDLGDWMVRLAEARVRGTFNAAAEPVSMEALLETCRDVAASDARIVWMDERFLLEHGIGPWMELPLWLPGDDAAFLQADVSRALSAGLRPRPIAETVRATLEWARSVNADLITDTQHGTAGLRPEREAELLEAWRTRA